VIEQHEDDQQPVDLGDGAEEVAQVGVLGVVRPPALGFADPLGSMGRFPTGGFGGTILRACFFRLGGLRRETGEVGP